MAIDTFFVFTGIYDEVGEALDAGRAGLVVVGVSDMETKIEHAMKRARKIEEKQLKADAAAIENDAKSDDD